jgi:hypothetical protein
MALRRLARKKFGPWEKRMANEEDRARFGFTSRTWHPECYVNNRYSVQVSSFEVEWGMVTHLWIRRHDGEPCRSWADLQRIKNELVGEKYLAIEVFPPVDELIDRANMFHLWVMPLGFELPFGLHGGRPS